MVKKFQSKIQNKDSEIYQLEKKIEDTSEKRAKLEENLKLRGFSTKEPEDGNGFFFHVDLTPYRFTFFYGSNCKISSQFF